MFLNSNKFKIIQPLSHLVICQNIVLEKIVSCRFSPSQHILNTNFISFILKWVGYARLTTEIDEPRSFKLFEYNTFINSACHPAV